MKQRRPFGLWPSPLQPADLAQETSIRDLAWDSDGKTLVWLHCALGHVALPRQGGERHSEDH